MLGTLDSFPTAEEVKENWPEITNFENPIYHTLIGESTNFVLTKIEEQRSGATSKRGTKLPNESEVGVYQYDFKDAILYAISLQMTTEDSLKYLYENHQDFSVFPSFGVIPAQASLFDSLTDLELPQGVNIDPTRLLHGEHYLELFKTLPTSAKLARKFKLVDVLDKGSGASLILNGKFFKQNYFVLKKITTKLIHFKWSHSMKIMRKFL